MKKGFFLDGVNMNGARKAINDRSQHPVDVDSDSTLTALARPNYAHLRT